MSAIAVIGGTGMNQWPGLEIEQTLKPNTPYGAPSAPLLLGRVHGVGVLFLARHGEGHKLAPHMINYRANAWALREAGAKQIVAISAVGGMSPKLPPAGLSVPHDLIDYSWGRAHTFFDGAQLPLKHIELTEPYAPRLRAQLLEAARHAGIEVMDHGVMGVTQGPRLESAAEIRRMRQDGCDMVGMTGMPEAALARELDLDYACIALSVNWAAGMGSGDIHGEIEACIAEGMAKVRGVLAQALPAIAGAA